MKLEDLKFLETREGEDLIKKLEVLKTGERDKLLFKTENSKRSLYSLACSLIELRKKAGDKFSKAGAMFFTSLGLEQSSSEKISDYIASRFKESWRIADLGCGIGGNLLALAKRTKSLIAIDENNEILEIARFNARAYNLENKIKFFDFKIEEFIKTKDFSGFDAVFLDPARDREGQTKTRSILNSRPNLLEILPIIFKETKNIAIKISPAFDWREIDLFSKLGEEPEVEVISENNNCKVVMLWFGEFKKAKRSLACFRGDETYFFSSGSDYGEIFTEAELDENPKFLFEPDKAFIKSGLSEEWAKENSLKKFDSFGRYLSLNQKIKVPGRTLETVFLKEISLRELKKELTIRKIERAEISAKSHFLKPDEIRKKLKLKEGGDYVIIFIESFDSKKKIFLGKRV